jgi:hypothetical protein
MRQQQQRRQQPQLLQLTLLRWPRRLLLPLLLPLLVMMQTMLRVTTLGLTTQAGVTRSRSSSRMMQQQQTQQQLLEHLHRYSSVGWPSAEVAVAVWCTAVPDPCLQHTAAVCMSA